MAFPKLLNPRRASWLGVIVAAVSFGCRAPASPSGPRSLLAEKPDGARARVDVVRVGDESRDALLASQSWTIDFPRRAILTFAVGARFDGAGEVPGWGRFVVALDGREVAKETVNPRVAHDWKDVTLKLEAPPRRGRLSISIRFTDKDGLDLPQPPDLTLAVSEPVLHDEGGYGANRGVILISVDTLRRDHVGAYGYDRPTTPALDLLARAGIVAEDAVSVSSWTLPAHLSMLTSVLPGTHGGVDSRQGFNRSVPTLAGILKRLGYATHAVTSHLYVSKTYGVDEGFDSMNFRQDRLAANVANHAMDLVDRFGDRPFFIFLHFYDPHWHYAPPPEVLKLFESSYAGKLTGNLKDFQNLRPDQVSQADLDHLRALYDGEIRYTDNEIGRLITHLKERDVWRNTMMLVTSDHGEEFLEHGSWEHQKTLYEEVVRIPLVVAGPGVAPRRETKAVNLLDVAPTILDFLKAGVPPTMKGVSLLQPVSDQRETYGETDQTPDGARLSFLRGGAASWKAILRSDPGKQAIRSSEWFDLAKDPGEKTNRPPAESLRAGIEARTREAALKSRSSAATKPVELSPEQREKLRALGYIGR
ncbi:MAG TPA: sulfatase [Vicinamibacteria bacterium]|nr:sulfatase [Vicinamibacteria bacterium]